MQDKNRSVKLIALALSVLLAFSSMLLYVNLEKVKAQDETIGFLTNQAQAQKEKISQLETSIMNLNQNLSLTERQLNNEMETRRKLENEILNLTMVNKRDFGILAVDENDVGHVIPLEIILKEGKGDLFINVAQVRYDETLQSSARPRYM